jgi:Gas vesicle protein
VTTQPNGARPVTAQPMPAHPMTAQPWPGRPGEEIALVDLLDRLLAGGVVLTGEVTISLAGVDLVHLSLRALISSVSTLAARL